MAVATQVKDNQTRLDFPCQYIKGVGPKRALLLKRMGLETVLDLFYLYPNRYEDRRTMIPIKKLSVGEFQTVQAKVVASGLKKTRRRLSLFQLALEDATGVLFATWFNQPYLKDRFKIGDVVILSGKVQWYGRELQMSAPDYEILEGDSTDLLHTGRIVPIYPLTDGLTQRILRMIIKNALDEHHAFVEEFLPEEILKHFSLMELKHAIWAVHYPQLMEEPQKARYRLTFEEFLILQLGIGIKRKIYQNARRIFQYRNVDEIIHEFTKTLPFPLTRAQQKAVLEMASDLQRSTPMNRLLQGDVGSGKTLVACFALYLAIRNGLQGALMVPTEVLAEQHYHTLDKFFKPLRIRVDMMVGDAKARHRREVLQNLEEGKTQILVGTHALLEEKVGFKNLGMVVIDEQHKFGVIQRSILRHKGVDPDVLVMTATPIPRTLSLTVYGDLEVSVLDELPPGRRKISTYWIKKSKLNDAYQFIAREIKKGAQAYIIYPLVEESEKSELKAATKMFKHLSDEIFQEFSLGLIHGRMKALEKNETLYRFRDRQIQILVSTTVIEVGIDIPNANIILIENAQAFGLAQLHQLRGRVGRGPQKSYCILEGDPHTPDGIERLKIMVETQDGFKIAEADLGIRGPGEFLGTRQHGLPEIRYGNLVTDGAMIKLARETAFQILDRDPHFKAESHQKLYEIVQKRFLEKSEYLSVG
jgi:ATP-dependent DNA helicase RecG